MRRLLSSSIALALGLLAAPSGALAQAVQDAAIAESLFREGQTLLKAGKVSEACPKFASSYKIDPGLGTLLNLAVCHEKEGKVASAWVEFSDAKAKAAKAGDKDREELAGAHAAALEPKLVKVQIFVSHVVEGISVELDGTPLPQAAWAEAFPLDPGEHKIEAKAPGRKPWSAAMVVPVSGIGPRLELPELEPIVAATVATEPAPTPVAKPHAAAVKPVNDAALKPVGTASAETNTGRLSRIVVGAAVTAAGLAGVGTAIGMGVKAKGLASDRDALCAPSAQWCFSQQALHDDHDARVAQAWSIGSAIVGGLLLGGGTWVMVGGLTEDATSAAPAPAPASPKEPKKENKDDFSLWLAPQAAPQALGFTLGGRF